MKVALRLLSRENILLFIRVCLPGTVFIGLCTGIFIAFITALGTITLTYRDPLFVGGAWLFLFLLYMTLGVILVRFIARFLNARYGSSVEKRTQRRYMALLSGLPFYAHCLLSLLTFALAALFCSDADICASAELFSLVGFVGFVLVSIGYLVLLRLRLGRLRVSAA